MTPSVAAGDQPTTPSVAVAADDSGDDDMADAALRERVTALELALKEKNDELAKANQVARVAMADRVIVLERSLIVRDFSHSVEKPLPVDEEKRGSER